MKLIINRLKNIKTFLIIIILAFACLSIWLFINSEFLKVDDCLDSGGRFNYETKECEY
ncbi:MAG: hypothetical protein GTN59_11095 [Candidatus Dadabacteria bacterium]|nr:hypothetical protein [Candidatus Dadabacteria bacterium]